MSEGGYIKLYRKIREHWIWEEPLYLKWWLDLLMLANHHPRKLLINNQFRIIETGEYHTSETKLAKRWFVDRKTVDKFLTLLEKDEMIAIEKNRKNGTTLKVLNYQDYQAIFDGDVDNRTDKRMDITIPKEAHKQEIKDIKEFNKFNNIVMSSPVMSSPVLPVKPDGQDKDETDNSIAEYEALEARIKENIDYNYFSRDRYFIDELIAIMVDAITSREKYIRIGNQEKSREIVKSRLLKLDGDHINYVIEKFKSLEEPVVKRKQYFLTMLYNASMEAESYFMQ